MGNSKKDLSVAPTFENSLKSLEALLEQLENPALPLDDLVAKYQEAQTRLSECRQLLDAFELKVKILTKNGAEDFDKTQ